MIALIGTALALAVLTPAIGVWWLASYARERDREGWR